MAKQIMVQGTMSGAGKSLLVTALCRIFLEDGYRVAPFKSQNMALNSFVTPAGLELGRAQAVQAEAAGIECDVRMNPILLKPTGDTGSQLIVNGEVRGDFPAREYFQMKRGLIPEILAAYRSLEAENDILVIEGAGSPAEINLREDDIVNMGLAELVNAPVLLTGDIDRGGVFAQLYGTVALLREEERRRVKGTTINKFRGDLSLLLPGLQQLEELTKIPVLGVVPWLRAEIDDEDSLAPRLSQKRADRALKIAVVRLPHLSNFTDFSPLEEHPEIAVYYCSRPDELDGADMLILPGTKNSMEDLLWLRERGLAERITEAAKRDTPIFGVCGGYQMLGRTLSDPLGVERRGTLPGLGLLPVDTVFTAEKTRTRRRAVCVSGPFAGAALTGYEIHMGKSVTEAAPFCRFEDGVTDGAVSGMVFGSYLHGLFDSGELTARLAELLAKRKGIELPKVKIESRKSCRERQYALLAAEVRQSLDMGRIYEIMEEYEMKTLPAEIERGSMDIIRAELRERGMELPTENAPVILRCIHASADFDYAENLRFTPRAAERAVEALKRGAVIVTDTNMALAGLSRPGLQRLGGAAYCFMAEPFIAERAKAEGTTRAAAAADWAAENCPEAVFAVGNAPTALFRLAEKIEKGLRPALVVGAPVGFVNVVEGKERILRVCEAYGVPAIVALGRKGGSSIAAAICNALIYTAADMLDPAARW